MRSGDKEVRALTTKLLSWKFLILLIAAVSISLAVFLIYLFHEEFSPYLWAIIVGRASGMFVVFTLLMWLTKRKLQTLTQN